MAEVTREGVEGGSTRYRAGVSGVSNVSASIVAILAAVLVSWLGVPAAGGLLIGGAALVLVERAKVREERLLVVPGVGIQTETEYGNGKVAARFFRIEAVRQVFVHEAITGCKVIACLAFVVHGQNKLVVAFSQSRLSQNALSKMYCELDNLLFEDD